MARKNLAGSSESSIEKSIGDKRGGKVFREKRRETSKNEEESAKEGGGLTEK